MIKAISISTDRGIFKEGTPIRLRTLEYANRMEALHIIVFTKEKEGYSELHFGNVHVYPTQSLSEWFYVLDGYRLGRRLIGGGKFPMGTTVITAQDAFQTGFVGARLSKVFCLPLQVQIHSDFLSEHFSKSLLNRVRQMIARYVIPKASGIRVVSETIKASLIREYPSVQSRVKILPIFVDIEGIISAEPAKDIHIDFPMWKQIIFMASRLSEEKDFDTAIEAFKKVHSELPDAGLVIAGSGPEQKKIEAKVRKLGLGGNVALIGWQKNLIPYYKTCDIFLLTSRYEGYGLTLIEASASGASIVTTKVGIAKDGLFQDGQNSYICEVGDNSDISAKIISLLKDRQKREDFSRNIQDAVRAYGTSANEYYHEYVDLLENLRMNNAIIKE